MKSRRSMAAELRKAGYRVEAPMKPAQAARANKLIDTKGHERTPGHDPKTGEYSTAQMLHDEIYGGDTSQPLFD